MTRTLQSRTTWGVDGANYSFLTTFFWFWRKEKSEMAPKAGWHLNNRYSWRSVNFHPCLCIAAMGDSPRREIQQVDHVRNELQPTVSNGWIFEFLRQQYLVFELKWTWIMSNAITVLPLVSPLFIPLYTEQTSSIDRLSCLTISSTSSPQWMNLTWGSLVLAARTPSPSCLWYDA